MVHELGQARLDFSCTWMLSVIREQGLHVERCHAERGYPWNSGVLCVYSLPFHLGSASCPFWPLALARGFLQCLTSCPRFHGSETSVLAFVLPHKSVATVRSYVCSTFYLLRILHVFFFFKRTLWSCFYECCY